MIPEQYDEKCYEYFDDIDDDLVIEIPHDMFDCDDEFTAITTKEDEVCTTTTPNQPPQPMNDPKPITENQVTPMIVED